MQVVQSITATMMYCRTVSNAGQRANARRNDEMMAPRRQADREDMLNQVI